MLSSIRIFENTLPTTTTTSIEGKWREKDRRSEIEKKRRRADGETGMEKRDEELMMGGDLSEKYENLC